MKNIISFIKYLAPAIMLVFITAGVSAQCVPMGPEECPDPENNGQVCPSTMPPGYLNQTYSEDATILVPQEYGIGIVLHHLTLIAVDNLPPGLTWQSNAANNEFLAGNYYCIVMEGTPSIADTFYLKIVIDIYLDILGQPVYFGQVIDSTSLAMIIYNENEIDEAMDMIVLSGSYPNPFSTWTNIRFTANEAQKGNLEVFSLLGEKIYTRELFIHAGDNNFIYNGEFLPAGTYCYVIRTDKTTVSKLFVRTD